MMRLLARLLAVVTMMWCASASAELPPVTSHTTPGGITFRHVQIDGLPRHTIAFGWHDAFARTMPGKEGLATLGRWLINEGSATLTRSDYSERLKDLQAATSFAGSTFHTTGSLTAPADKLGEAAALFGDLLANPALAPDHFALLQKSIAAGARQAAERPETLAHLMMRRLTLGPGPDLDATVVAPEAYARLSVADVTAWHKAVLVQDTVLIASAGPMQPHAVAREIDRLFAGLPKSSPAPVATPPVPKLHARGKTVVLERPVVQTINVAEGPSGWVNSPDAVRATLAQRSMLGFDGRLLRAVRERLGAAYGVNGQRFAYHPMAESFVISTSVDSKRAVEALAAIRAEYANIVAEGVPEPVLTALITKLLGEIQESLRQSEGAARLVRAAMLAGYPDDHYATLEARVRGLTAADINDGLRTKFPKAPLAVVIIAPSANGFDADCVIKSPSEIGRCE